MVDLWNAHEFREGLWFGVIAATVLLLVGVAVSARRRARPLPIGGVVLAAGGLWSISNAWNVPAAVVLGVIGVGAAAALARVSVDAALVLRGVGAAVCRGDRISGRVGRRLVGARARHPDRLRGSNSGGRVRSHLARGGARVDAHRCLRIGGVRNGARHRGRRRAGRRLVAVAGAGLARAPCHARSCRCRRHRRAPRVGRRGRG